MYHDKKSFVHFARNTYEWLQGLFHKQATWIYSLALGASKMHYCKHGDCSTLPGAMKLLGNNEDNHSDGTKSELGKSVPSFAEGHLVRHICFLPFYWKRRIVQLQNGYEFGFHREENDKVSLNHPSILIPFRVSHERLGVLIVVQFFVNR